MGILRKCHRFTYHHVLPSLQVKHSRGKDLVIAVVLFLLYLMSIHCFPVYELLLHRWEPLIFTDPEEVTRASADSPL